MTLTHSVLVQVKPQANWNEGLLIKLGVYADQPTLAQPGKDVGDMRLLLSDCEDLPSQVLMSLGTREKFNADNLRRAGGLLVKWLEKNNIPVAGLEFAGLSDLPVSEQAAFSAFIEGVFLGAFQFTKHKSTKTERPLLTLDWLLDEAELQLTDTLTEIIGKVKNLTGAVNLARSWAHEPPNIINPITLAQRLGQLASKEGLGFSVLDDRQLAEMGANAIVSVGKGSHTPSRLIVLQYAGKDPTAKPVVLVGKAITFDTGGYSTKDPQGMVGMKYDKSGGMAVIATVIAAARLGIKTPIVGIIAAAENMISGEAYRPNDILVTLAGKTVEVISADAEGRLVLCDALTYAQDNYQPRILIDLATLTGGVVVALGKLRGGILGNNQALIQALIQSGEHTHERLWQLPLDDEYFELIKGDDSDFKNSGAREAHATIGGIFLKQFVKDDIPWAHLDIAGVADTDKDKPYCQKGATGFGVRLLIDYLENLE
ncbi:MAG: leucyl aminopeptidase [Anaerolineales bacterium]|jgi:leucyl aminopeptidase|nr:leucyl aminopeptidase [Anaerolineales bacterium]